MHDAFLALLRGPQRLVDDQGLLVRPVLLQVPEQLRVLLCNKQRGVIRDVQHAQ